MSDSQSLSPLGTLRKLPPEIRFNVWRFLMPTSPLHHQEKTMKSEGLDSRLDIYERPQTRLSILCASRELYEEISKELYRRELCFNIWSGNPSPTYKPVRSLLIHFKNTPLHRFRNIAITIQAPVNSHSDGMILFGMRFVMAVVKYLIFDFYWNMDVPVLLHQIDIKLVNGAGTTWFGADGWQQSIPEYLILNSDYLLGPFKLMSNMGSLKVHVPDGLENDPIVTNWIREVTTSM